MGENSDAKPPIPAEKGAPFRNEINAIFGPDWLGQSQKHLETAIIAGGERLAHPVKGAFAAVSGKLGSFPGGVGSGVAKEAVYRDVLIDDERSWKDLMGGNFTDKVRKKIERGIYKDMLYHNLTPGEAVQRQAFELVLFGREAFTTDEVEELAVRSKVNTLGYLSSAEGNNTDNEIRAYNASFINIDGPDGIDLDMYRDRKRTLNMEITEKERMQYRDDMMIDAVISAAAYRVFTGGETAWTPEQHEAMIKFQLELMKKLMKDPDHVFESEARMATDLRLLMEEPDFFKKLGRSAAIAQTTA